MTEQFPPLETEIRRRITVSGPMPVMHYMTQCLTHPSLGYYVANDPFGSVLSLRMSVMIHAIPASIARFCS